MKRTWMLATGLALATVGLGGCALMGAVAHFGQPASTRAWRGGARGWDGTSSRLDLPQTAPPAGATSGLSAGQQLYLTGIGHVGRVAHTGGPAWFERIDGGCVGCHGADGTSRTVTSVSGGGIATGDIRYDSLVAGGTATEPTATARAGATTESTATVGGWTDEDIVAAIRDGVGPDGSALDATMPRWTMDDTDMAALLAYLKELSSR